MSIKLVWPSFALLLLVVCCTFAQDASDEKIRVDTNLVSVPVIVSDRNDRYIPNLRSVDFTLLQDGTAQKIEFFAATEEPLTIALLIDTSFSTEPVLGDIRDSARAFIKLLQPKDQAMIVSFDHQIQVLSPLTSNQDQLRKAINKAEIPEYFGTVLRDAANQTIRNTLAAIKGRKAIILLTDGKDAGSYISDRQLLFALEESDTLIYTIMFQTGNQMRRGPNGGPGWGGFDPQGGPRRFPRRDNSRRAERQARANREAQEFLERMSEISAGRFYSSKDGKLKTTFAAIVEELRFQYRLGFYPPEESEGPALHQIRVKVARPDAVVRARAGYRILSDK